MNNDIKEDYVIFEVAKLLKEKDFDVDCKSHYELAVKPQKDKQDGYSGPFGWKKGELNIQNDFNTNTTLKKYYTGVSWVAYSRPTTALAIKWIRENFEINVSVFFDESFKYTVHIMNSEETPRMFSLNGFKSQEEAENAAILHILKKK